MAPSKKVSPQTARHVINFAPPADAVKNVYLRMRIIADWEDKQACDTPAYGQIEDYAVRILDPDTLSSPDFTKLIHQDKVVYVKVNNKLQLQSDKTLVYIKFMIWMGDCCSRELLLARKFH